MCERNHVLEAQNLARQAVRDCPLHNQRIQEAFHLFIDEISDGGSIHHEFELFESELQGIYELAN